ncbi:hypothetical protein [Arthrobacter burdickii]|uniref:Integral membrane protein n=1 Tax=Arthrobacter burdickii TaxID=3035920 RepID=A0ABT8K283_9MICC|nr:hypothetical protein [Arthrobacter burdickii]MDN4610499.1 hypothetical protein [Arthrobacter burdickii]
MTEASEGQRTIRPEPSTSGQGSSPGTDGSAPGTTGASASGASTLAAGTTGQATGQAAGQEAGTVVGRTAGQSSASSSAGPSSAVLGPFTLRELVFGGGVVIAFIGTLLPFTDGRVLYANFWNSVQLFFIGIGILLPVVALALLAGRRLGSSNLRVGSLSADQFASVSAVLAATFFFLQTVTAFHPGPLLALIGSLLMVAATVVGPFLPVFRNDFADRPETPAHTVARPITAARPRPPKPAKPAAEAKDGPTVTASRSESGSAGVNPAAAAVRQNGAGLYGAGGAGAVGAGAAASGQSGMEREGSENSSTSASPVSTSASTESHAPRHVESGAHAIGADEENGVHRPSPDHSSDAVPAQPATDTVGETRIQDVVHDGSTAAPAGSTSAASAPAAEERRQETITATRSTDDEEPVVEAFWFAVGSSRPVFDEQTGRQVFTLQPGDWEVGIEDRGNEFLVQDKRTGAVGILRDLRNIERAPRD